ncbi:hypothetical protein G3I01_13380 [Gramella sp. MT6]|uniref:hypothetical protein n=1 Tax=Gramella sp. MT6 TaxID=2705471 RepID=UPI001C5D7045|nr:hypothetical protein [Gramella sp. MT6]QYA26449.1 hypothetical protein G3I01_13380 [Gramella sp. MT6]
MSEDKNNEQADWQKNSGRPSNFHEKDDKLRKDGDGNLKIKKDRSRITSEEEETIQDTLDSISGTEEDEEEK